MILENNTNYYEVLEITPDATPNEIRQSYLRLKMAYGKDSVALYTLVSKEETDDILIKVEEAYQVLSNEEKRREYDRNYIHESRDDESPFSSSASARRQNEADNRVVSIDRVPPMDKTSREEDLLVAPVTDFSGSSAGMNAMPPTPSPAPEPESQSMQPMKLVRGKEVARGTTLDPALEEEIAREIEWGGLLLRKIREARRISIEEMADFTKISKTYLFAIENEDYTKLPAATFVRGFVMQVAKRLKLPHDKVAAAYVSRYRKSCPDKA